MEEIVACNTLNTKETSWLRSSNSIKTEVWDRNHLIYNKLQQGVKSINFCSRDIPVFHLKLGSDKINFELF